MLGHSAPPPAVKPGECVAAKQAHNSAPVRAYSNPGYQARCDITVCDVSRKRVVVGPRNVIRIVCNGGRQKKSPREAGFVSGGWLAG